MFGAKPEQLSPCRLKVYITDEMVVLYQESSQPQRHYKHPPQTMVVFSKKMLGIMGNLFILIYICLK